jgi:hypothetical protein
MIIFNINDVLVFQMWCQILIAFTWIKNKVIYEEKIERQIFHIKLIAIPHKKVDLAQ